MGRHDQATRSGRKKSPACRLSAIRSARSCRAAASSGTNPSFNLVNRGQKPLQALYAAPVGQADWGPNRLGGAHIVVDPDTPGNAGGPFVARKLGIKSAKDVP